MASDHALRPVRRTGGADNRDQQLVIPQLADPVPVITLKGAAGTGSRCGSRAPAGPRGPAALADPARPRTGRADRNWPFFCTGPRGVTGPLQLQMRACSSPPSSVSCDCLIRPRRSDADRRTPREVENRSGTLSALPLAHVAFRCFGLRPRQRPALVYVSAVRPYGNEKSSPRRATRRLSTSPAQPHRRTG